jgi:hypothetical protein
VIMDEARAWGESLDARWIKDGEYREGKGEDGGEAALSCERRLTTGESAIGRRAGGGGGGGGVGERGAGDGQGRGEAGGRVTFPGQARNPWVRGDLSCAPTSFHSW